VKTAETIASPLSTTTSRSQWLLLVLATGIVARAFWLCLGASSLARLRRSAVPVDPHSRLAVERRRPRRRLRFSSGRHDWLNVVAEEIVRTIFWFHPVLWWLIDRTQLSREHVVDEAVVALTKSRERLEAMLAVALTRSPLSFAPAPQFLRRRSLKRRVAHILQETTMTTRRLIASVVATAGVVIVTGVLVVRAFPLEARAPQQEARIDANTPVAIARGGEYLLHASLPEYPRRALDQRVEGEVALEIAVDDQGEVSDARVVSGPDELRRAALESVLQWHYLASRVSNTTLPVALRFNAAAVVEETRKVAGLVKTAGVVVRKDGEKLKPYFVEYRPFEKREQTPSKEMEVEIKKLEVALRTAPGHVALPQRLAGVRTERVSNGLVKEILDRAGLSVGAMIPSEMALTQIRETIQAFDPHLRVRYEHDAKGGLILVLIAP
jgi:TonB family protein